MFYATLPSSSHHLMLWTGEWGERQNVRKPVCHPTANKNEKQQLNPHFMLETAYFGSRLQDVWHGDMSVSNNIHKNIKNRS